MTTNNAAGILANANAVFAAVNDKLNNDKQYAQPAIIGDPISQPNPDISTELADQVTAIQANATALADYASNN